MPDDTLSDFATTTVVNALAQTSAGERLELLSLLATEASNLPSSTEILRQPGRSIAFRTAAVFVINQLRRAADGSAAGAGHALAAVRGALEAMVPAETRAGVRPLMTAAVAPTPGADRTPNVTEMSDGRFIQIAFEKILERGCHPQDLRDWQIRLERGQATRASMLSELFDAALREAAADRANEARHDPHALHAMGTGERVTLADWQVRAERLKGEGPAAGDVRERHARFPLTAPPRMAVTAIASLYRGGRHIRRFMENITRQTCFRDYVELIIVDADSPDDEQAVIEPYLAEYPNIRYLRINHRIGVYEAWNRAVAEARGEYLTSTNVDDLRREDSLELQMTTLDALPFADVVYQDFYYTFDPDLSYEEVARFGVRARLPLVTRHTLLDCNPPHNAPMWRRRLHDELGPFDTHYQSAADYDFWMRCVAADKVFYKLNDPHVVYYQNPEGLSTRVGTRGFAETREVHRRRDREVVSELFVMPIHEFHRQYKLTWPTAAEDEVEDRARDCYWALVDCAKVLKYGRATVEAQACAS